MESAFLEIFSSSGAILPIYLTQLVSPKLEFFPNFRAHCDTQQKNNLNMSASQTDFSYHSCLYILQELRQAFQMFDRNRDGYVDAKELKKVTTTLGNKHALIKQDQFHAKYRLFLEGYSCVGRQILASIQLILNSLLQ